jgi:hypothetical protein
MPKVTISTPVKAIEVEANATTIEDVCRVCRANGIPFKLNYNAGKPIYPSFISRGPRLVR